MRKNLVTAALAAGLVLPQAVASAGEPVSSGYAQADRATKEATASVRRVLGAINRKQPQRARRNATPDAVRELMRFRARGYQFRGLDPCRGGEDAVTRTCAAELYDGRDLVGSMYLEVEGRPKPPDGRGVKWVVVSAFGVIGE